MYVAYPKWIFHKTEAAKIVQTKEEHEQAGEGWEEAPFAVGQESDAKAEESTSDKDESKAHAHHEGKNKTKKVKHN